MSVLPPRSASQPGSSSRSLGVGLVYAATAIATLPVYGRDWHVAGHVAGALVLVGTVTVMGVWMAVVVARGQEAALRRGVLAVARADLWLTGPAVVLVLGNGVGMAVRWWGGWAALVSISWIAAGVALMAVTGAIWVGVLVPAQVYMARVARSGGPLDDGFRVRLRRWMALGTVATVLPWAALVVMQTKPALW